MTTVTIPQAFEIALAHHQAGRLLEAEAIYRQILAQQPNHADALHLLGVLSSQTGHAETGVGLIRQAIALASMVPDYYSNLGDLLYSLGAFPEAAEACRRAIALRPDYAEAYNNLGNALKSQDLLAEAAAAYRRAIALNPNFPETYNNLGWALQDQGQLDDAIAAFHRAIALRPDYAEAYNNLGNALKSQDLLAEAAAAYRRAVALNPNLPEVHNNLGNALKDQGQMGEAIAAFRRAVALTPDDERIHSNLVFTLRYHLDYDAPAIAEAQRLWNMQHALPLAPLIRPYVNAPDPNKRLKIGYVSADLCEHVVGYNLLPLFREHDPRQVEVFCYADVPRPDAMTQMFRSHAHAWRDIVGLTDEQAAELIREDGIDILVDLALHTAQNRLLVFARKPAPVQVSFAGYPGSTGLDAIPYHLTDPFLEPPGQQDDFSADEAVRLPDSFWCYAATAVHLPVGPLPSEANGYITFGCLNNLCKVNPGVLRLWAKVLREVAGSRLLLLARQGSGREWIQAALREEGIESDRVEFADHQSRWKYLETYRRIDVGLDTLPYNGHTTSLDSLWMGVPVVTLVGTTVVGRAGLSQLSNLGLPELVAWTADEYVEIAAGLAGDRSRLASLRSSLRGRMQSSPLMEAPKFARGVEAAYRHMWHRWCGGDGVD